MVIIDSFLHVLNKHTALFCVCTGLILYNGQTSDGTGDFISLGMRDRRIEFRLDVGSGPAVIVSRQLELDTWYTVRIKRDGRNGNTNKTRWFVDISL